MLPGDAPPPDNPISTSRCQELRNKASPPALQAPTSSPHPGDPCPLFRPVCGGRWQASSWPWVSMATMDCGPTSRTAVHPAWGPYLCQTGRDDTAGPRCGISPHLEPHKQVEVGDTYYKPQRCSAIPRGHEPLSSPPFLTPKAPESELSGEFQGQCSPGCAREQQCWGVSTGLCSLLPSPPS